MKDSHLLRLTNYVNILVSNDRSMLVNNNNVK